MFFFSSVQTLVGICADLVKVKVSSVPHDTSPFYYVLENWDVRDGNLKKQAHLLSKAELKRRGITRYDAEIILAQGQSLPEPKVNLGSKVPIPARRNQLVKVSELRLSPRKHVSSQSYLKSLSPVSTAGQEGREKKKPLEGQSSGRQAKPLSDITSIKSEKQHSGESIENRKSFSQKCAHRAATRSQKNGHNAVLKLDLDCIDSRNQGEVSASGLRHSPRLRNKDAGQCSAEIKGEPGEKSPTKITVNTGDPDITFKYNRNIFTEFQSNVKQEVDSEAEERQVCKGKCRSRLGNQCPTLLNQLKAPPPDMPHLIPYDTDPQYETMCKTSKASPKLTSYKTSDQSKHAHVRKHSLGYENAQSSIVTNLKSPIRYSPRNKHKNQGSAMKRSSANGIKGGMTAQVYDCDCREVSSSNGEKDDALASHGHTSKCKGNKYKGGNVFDKFNSISDKFCSTAEYKAHARNGRKDGDFGDCGDSRQNVNGSLKSFRGLEDGRSSRSSPRLKNGKERKRRLSFGDVGAPKFGEPLRKRINTVTEDLAEYRHLWANISPIKKIPKITIKMRRDPVLEKELEKSVKSDGVHFKLESPQCSVHGTPDSSDMSDSDEEESPLNCTKFRPNLFKQENGAMASHLYSDDRKSERVCPKLMKIKFGGTQININIPQHS